MGGKGRRRAAEYVACAAETAKSIEFCTLSMLQSCSDEIGRWRQGRSLKIRRTPAGGVGRDESGSILEAFWEHKLQLHSLWEALDLFFAEKSHETY